MKYSDVVEILKISQDRLARDERFETFKRAIAFHGVAPACAGAAREGEGVILVGGTNGKGTVSATLARLLREAAAGGVGLFTSPHLIEPTERISIDGEDISPDEMVAAYLAIEPTVQRFDLSHFEILTLMMIEVFFGGRLRPRVSRAIIEVGVGGRLDPTRAIPHETAVLARIGLDHEAILGSTLQAIAREKLAIAEGASRLIYMKPPPSLEAVFTEARLKYGDAPKLAIEDRINNSLETETGTVNRHPCEFIEARTFASEVSLSNGIPQWILKTPWGPAPLALMGERAVQNTSLALEVLHHLGEPVATLLPALADVRWPGRMERVSVDGRAVYLSGDHNEQGVESLRELLSHFEYDRLWLVVGIGKGKPVDAMLAQYKRIPRAKLVLTRTSFRPIDEASFAALEVETKIDDALEALRFAATHASPGDLVVVSGSLYLVGDLKARLICGS